MTNYKELKSSSQVRIGQKRCLPMKKGKWGIEKEEKISNAGPKNVLKS